MSLAFKIEMGDFELEESGSIITTKDSEIRFGIQDLEYVFSFVNEENIPAQLRTKSNDGKRLEVELVNFNNPLGMGNNSPVPMGRIGEKLLFILIRVDAFENGSKTLQYSWYSKPIGTNDNIQLRNGE